MLDRDLLVEPSVHGSEDQNNDRKQPGEQRAGDAAAEGGHTSDCRV